MRIHQLIAAAAPGDAVTGQALAWQGLLRGWGAEGLVIAEHVHPAMEGRARRADRSAAELRSGDGLILHYSVWSRVVDDALAATGPLAVCYHNVTPGHLLRPWNPGLADACDRGRAALPRLAGRTVALIADSGFNARELAEAGLGEGPYVVPLLLDLPAAVPAPRAPGTPPSVVTVGRIVPNKRIEDVLRAFVLFRGRHAPSARLTLVGDDGGFATIRAALEDLAARIGGAGIRFALRASEAERDRVYATADAYLCMSEHEGFCAPLVEAAGARRPRGRARRGRRAPRDGRRGRALVVEHDLLPLAAEALTQVIASPQTRAGLARAARRAGALDPAVTAGRRGPRSAPVLDPVLGAARASACACRAGGAALRRRGQRRRRGSSRGAWPG